MSTNSQDTAGPNPPTEPYPSGPEMFSGAKNVRIEPGSVINMAGVDIIPDGRSPPVSNVDPVRGHLFRQAKDVVISGSTINQAGRFIYTSSNPGPDPQEIIVPVGSENTNQEAAADPQHVVVASTLRLCGASHPQPYFQSTFLDAQAVGDSEEPMMFVDVD